MTPPDLVRKYDALLRLRATLTTPLSPDDRDALRALAAEFPSALRELDGLDTATLAARRDAAGSAEPPPWVDWMCRYHARMRDELVRRREGDRERAPQGRLQRRVFEAIAAEVGQPIDEIWNAVLPMGGRSRAHRGGL